MPFALLGAAAVFGVAVLVSFGRGQGVAWPSLHGLSTALDGVEALLCVLALDRIAAARWSAQFAVVPLLVLVEGVALLHSPVATRFVVGLLLLAAASIALLAPPSEEPRLGLGVVHAEARRTE